MKEGVQHSLKNGKDFIDKDMAFSLPVNFYY